MRLDRHHRRRFAHPHPVRQRPVAHHSSMDLNPGRNKPQRHEQGLRMPGDRFLRGARASVEPQVVRDHGRRDLFKTSPVGCCALLHERQRFVQSARRLHRHHPLCLPHARTGQFPIAVVHGATLPGASRSRTASTSAKTRFHCRRVVSGRCVRSRAMTTRSWCRPGCCVNTCGSMSNVKIRPLTVPALHADDGDYLRRFLGRFRAGSDRGTPRMPPTEPGPGLPHA
jgi:hypothetical protein